MSEKRAGNNNLLSKRICATFQQSFCLLKKSLNILYLTIHDIISGKRHMKNNLIIYQQQMLKQTVYISAGNPVALINSSQSCKSVQIL